MLRRRLFNLRHCQNLTKRKLKPKPRYFTESTTCPTETATTTVNKTQNIPPVPGKEIRQQFFCAAVPMFGFGFMDNTIMIHAGDYIDNTFGLTFGLATLAAASCGQVFSDSFGVLFGNYIDVLASRLGMKAPNVTSGQRGLTSFRLATTAGSLIGVILGCLVGMCNLLFLDLGRKERLERQRELDDIFNIVMRKGPNMFDCECLSLFLYDPVDNLLWCKVASNGARIEVPLDAPGVCTAVYKSREFVQIEHEDDELLNKDFVQIETVTEDDELLNKKANGVEDFVTRNMIACPVIVNDKVVAVMEVINKKDGLRFDKEDKKMLYVLSDHVALFMEKFEYDEANTTRHGELLKKNTFWSKIKFIREKFHDRYHAVATEQQTQTPQVT